MKFEVLNPDDMVTVETSIKMTIYDDTDLKYKIDRIEDRLIPTFECSYPCRSCMLEDTTNCTDCPDGVFDPRYLQRFDDGYQTCVVECEDGYTYDSLSENRTCIKCHESCKTC